ncbi:MAG: RluA family pseudouridine synthase [Flavobacteriales bacterium]|nr:RluA family pseudouridine synthase [Flavobacteriales bacterium]
MSSTEGAPALEVLHQDVDLCVVLKPGGMPAQPDPTGSPSAIEVATRQSGAERLWLVHRLDRPVAGVLLFARNAKAAAGLDAQFRSNSVDKRYWALVEGRFELDAERSTYGYTELKHHLRHDTKAKSARVAAPGERGARAVVIHVRPMAFGDRYTLVEVVPQGGAFHQIRAQLAAAGHAIKGDVKYGARRGASDRSIALFARSLEFIHPSSGKTMRLEAPAPQAPPWDTLVRSAMDAKGTE